MILLLLLWKRIAFLFFVGCTLFVNNVESKDEVMVVGGYMPDYRSYIDLNAASKHLTDVILFSISPKADGTLSNTCCLNNHHFQQAHTAKQSSPDLRIWVSIGGAGRSNDFPSLVSNPKSRRNFVTELMQLCLKEQISGIDFDWEQPQNQADFEGYMHLIQEASAVLHSMGYLISIAVHPRQFLPVEIYNLVDQVHIMTYDMIVKNKHNEFHHSDSSQMIHEINLFMEKGCPPSKIVVGIPMYGRHVRDVNSVKTYSELMDTQPPEIQKNRHTLYKMDQIDNYSFDSPSDIRKKIQYALSHGLKGIFFWEIGQDFQNKVIAPGGLLLESATNAIQQTIHESSHDEF